MPTKQSRQVVRPFYHYIIYRIYEWRLKDNDHIPVFATFITLFLVHIVQLSAVLFILTILSEPFSKFFLQLRKWEISLFVIALGAVYYLSIVNKKKWDSYRKRFELESDRSRKRGTFVVLLFTLGSIITFLLMSILYVLFSTWCCHLELAWSES